MGIGRTTISSESLCCFVLNNCKAELTAQCKLCSGGKKNSYKYSEKSKTNLKAHLNFFHSGELSEKNLKEALKSSNPFTMRAISAEDQAKIADAVVPYVTEDGQPISHPEKPSFRKFMGHAKLSWKPIGRKTCRGKLL